jgi:hexosaminidase
VDGASLETGQYLAELLFKSTGYRFEIRTNAAGSPVRGAVLLTTVNANSSLGAEGYELTVAPDSVVIRAPAVAGVFYGVQTLLQLLPPQVLAQHSVSGVQWTIPCVYILDQPRFA